MTESAQLVQVDPEKRYDVFHTDCPARGVVDHVTSRWGIWVLISLRSNALRFYELRDGIQGISEKMLAQTLKTLEGDGFIRRDAQPVIPPRVDYSLTDRGEELVALLLPLVTWIAGHAAEIVAPRRPERSPSAGMPE